MLSTAARIITADAQRRRLDAAVLAYLRRVGGAEAWQVADALHISRYRAQRRLRRLHTTGRVRVAWVENDLFTYHVYYASPEIRHVQTQ